MSGSHHQSNVTSAQVVKTSVNVTPNSPSQDYTHLDGHNLPTYDMTPGHRVQRSEVRAERLVFLAKDNRQNLLRTCVTRVT